MKQVFLLICLVSIVMFSCKKDDIDNESNKLIGAWEVKEIKAHNVEMSQLKEMVFSYGSYEFRRNNSFTYTSSTNNTINGTWAINRRLEHPCNNCASIYSYGLTVKSHAVGDDIQGWFSDLRLFSNELTMKHFVVGSNRWFDYVLRKK